jgi:hypothetical protein
MGAALHDSQAVDHLLTRNNTGAGVWADAAYRSEEMKAKLKARKLTSHIHRKGKRGKPLTEQAKGSNRTKSSVRVRVEHLFGAQVPIASLGSFDLQLPYAFALLLGALLCLFPGQFAIGLKHLPSALTPRLVTYVVYLLILHFSFAGGQSQGIVLRQVFFLTCGCIFALGIVATGANPRVLNRTVRHEWLDQYIIKSIEEAQDHATQWLCTYNNDRPTMGIGGITPAMKLKMAA